MKNKKLTQIYTGDGKGKTTAAVGLAVRAQAHGFKVCYVSFHKDPSVYKNGEQKTLKKLGITVRCFAPAHPMCKKTKTSCKKDLAKQANSGLNFIQKVFEEKRYDMVIADEINICVRDGYIKEQDVIALMKNKPQSIEFVMTGRKATKKMIKNADLVSFIKEKKHPYSKGILARKGIEY
jgi:cob(I)alamin adenosyltransferase